MNRAQAMTISTQMAAPGGQWLAAMEAVGSCIWCLRRTPVMEDRALLARTNLAAKIGCNQRPMSARGHPIADGKNKQRIFARHVKHCEEGLIREYVCSDCASGGNCLAS